MTARDTAVHSENLRKINILKLMFGNFEFWTLVVRSISTYDFKPLIITLRPKKNLQKLSDSGITHI